MYSEYSSGQWEEATLAIQEKQPSLGSGFCSEIEKGGEKSLTNVLEFQVVEVFFSFFSVPVKTRDPVVCTLLATTDILRPSANTALKCIQCFVECELSLAARQT